MEKQEFVLDLDPEKFRSTNDAWNSLMLNDPWSVGYVSSLIETKEWNSKEEWENFYYESGKKRNSLILNNATTLNNFSLPLKGKSYMESLPWNLKNLNYQYGRTLEDLQKRAEALYEMVKDNGYNLTVEDCLKCVRFRTICETWNGIIIRENRTIETLKTIFPDIDFEKTPGDVDHTYAVDYELKRNGKLLCAIQIKPKSYLGFAPYLQKARQANLLKNRTYKNLYHVDVYNVISKSNGEIINNEVIQEIRNAITNN